MGIAGYNVAQQSPATGSGLHAVLTGDVVLDDEGNAVERTANLTLSTLLIQLLGNGESIRVELQDGTKKLSAVENHFRQLRTYFR
jgi:hypothetical protein